MGKVGRKRDEGGRGRVGGKPRNKSMGVREVCVCVGGGGGGEKRGWERRGRKCWEVGGSEKGEGGIQKGMGGGGGEKEECS